MREQDGHIAQENSNTVAGKIARFVGPVVLPVTAYGLNLFSKTSVENAAVEGADKENIGWNSKAILATAAVPVLAIAGAIAGAVHHYRSDKKVSLLTHIKLGAYIGFKNGVGVFGGAMAADAIEGHLSDDLKYRIPEAVGGGAAVAAAAVALNEGANRLTDYAANRSKPAENNQDHVVEMAHVIVEQQLNIAQQQQIDVHQQQLITQQLQIAHNQQQLTAQQQRIVALNAQQQEQARQLAAQQTQIAAQEKDIDILRGQVAQAARQRRQSPQSLAGRIGEASLNPVIAASNGSNPKGLRITIPDDDEKHAPLQLNGNGHVRRQSFSDKKIVSVASTPTSTPPPYTPKTPIRPRSASHTANAVHDSNVAANTVRTI